MRNQYPKHIAKSHEYPVCFIILRNLYEAIQSTQSILLVPKTCLGPSEYPVCFIMLRNICKAIQKYPVCFITPQNAYQTAPEYPVRFIMFGNICKAIVSTQYAKLVFKTHFKESRVPSQPQKFPESIQNPHEYLVCFITFKNVFQSAKVPNLLHHPAVFKTATSTQSHYSNKRILNIKVPSN